MDIYINDSSLDQSIGKYGVMLSVHQEDKIENLEGFIDILSGLQFLFKEKTAKDSRSMLNKKALLPLERAYLYSSLNIKGTHKLTANTSEQVNKIMLKMFTDKDVMSFYAPEPDSDYSMLSATIDVAPTYLVDLHKAYIKRSLDKQTYINKVLPLLTDDTKKTFDNLIESRLVTD